MPQKPEKITESSCLTWLNVNGFVSDVFDSKAIFSAKIGRYKKNYCLPEGCSDLIASDPVGRACYIELKAKGKRNNISLEQFKFLSRRIDGHCFAVVVDSAQCLEHYYKEWSGFIRASNFNGARDYLRSMLPKFNRAE